MHGLDDEKDIKPWLRRFHELDADGSGRLDMQVKYSTCNLSQCGYCNCIIEQIVYMQ
jgi:hypothetical protein